LLTCSLGLLAFARDRRMPLRSGAARWGWAPIALALLALTVGLRNDIERTRNEAVQINRGFHGVLRVHRYGVGTPFDAIALIHGRTSHGLQFLAQERRLWPTLYFSWNSGAGQVFRHHEPQRARRVGVVGMGAGTLAFYGRAGDEIRFYEIDAAVSEIALSLFSFVGDSQAESEVVIGDARSSLEREAPNLFDILFLDAFSSDSIPVHLLTREAFDLYARHLAPDGVIAANISSAHLDLEPLLRGLAEHLGMQARSVHSPSDGQRGIASAHWMLLSSNTAFLDSDEIAAVSSPGGSRESVLWTDDHANVLGALRILAD
jgi:spermidine synthase